MIKSVPDLNSITLEDLRYVPIEGLDLKTVKTKEMDVYAIGMIIYEFLEEDIPFKEIKDKETLFKEIKELRKVPVITRELKSPLELKMKLLMQRCFNIKEKRPSVEEILNELEWEFSKLLSFRLTRKVIRYLDEIYEECLLYKFIYAEALSYWNDSRGNLISQKELLNFDSNKNYDHMDLFFYANFFFMVGDSENGEKYLKKSADFGNKLAFECLGFHYERIGNLEESIKYMSLACNNGNSNSLIYVGKKLFNQDNYKGALEMFHLAAKLNHYYGFYWIGVCYLNGLGVKKDIDLAIEYFEKSSILECTDAYTQLGTLYLQGIEVPIDYEKGLNFLNLAIEDECTKAMNTMAFFHFEILKKYKEALYYYSLSADLGDEIALYNCGVFYDDGIGVEKDTSKSISYFKEAAERGYQNAYQRLGNIYEKGEKIPRNLFKALKYYQRGESKEYKRLLKSKELLDEGIEKLNQKLYPKALKIFEKTDSKEYLDFLKTFRFKFYQFNNMLDITFKFNE